MATVLRAPRTRAWAVLASTCILGDLASAVGGDIEINRVEREWRYLAQRATYAQSTLGERPDLAEIIS